MKKSNTKDIAEQDAFRRLFRNVVRPEIFRVKIKRKFPANLADYADNSGGFDRLNNLNSVPFSLTSTLCQLFFGI